MANVGTGTAGKVLTATGVTSSSTFANIGTNSGLTARGVVVAEGASPFQATAAGTNGQVLIGSNASNPAFGTITSSNGSIAFTSGSNSLDMTVASGAMTVQTLTGNSGGAISPTAGNINTIGAGSITTAGSGSTLTTQLTGLTNHTVLVGAGTTTITKVGPGTAGQILQSGGASADPAYSTSTYPATNAVSTLLYASSANVMAALPTANNGVLVTDGSGVPSIGSTLPTAVQGNITSTGNLGNQLNTTRTAFAAYVNTSIANVTGDATLYTVIFDTEVFDQANNFNLGTSTFTAPVTGKYQINYTCRLSGGTVISATIMSIVASNIVWRGSLLTNPGSTATANASMSALIDMDAADTATFTVQSTDSGGKIDDVLGLVGGQPVTFVSGYLVC